MTYYKIIINNQIIGVATSMNCLRFQNKHLTLERTVDDLAEYIECIDQLYHATWMAPIKTDIYHYTIAAIIEISQEEYTILVPAIENNPIPIEENEEEEQPVISNDDPDITVEFVRKAKINEMSRACNQIIEAGFDITLNENVEHFSLTTQDQLNLISLSAMAQAGTEAIPYHADGQICRFYTAAEINQIVSAATQFKIYQTTYYNALKNYINSLDTIEEIAAITYGTSLPEEYKSEVLKALEE